LANFAARFFPPLSVPPATVFSFLPAVSCTTPYPGQIFALTPGLQLPRSYQWNVALEKSFGGTQTFSVTYLGQAGRDLLREEALYQRNPNFSGLLYITQNNAFSNYNALQVQYRRPLARSVQALLNYTYSHSLDNASNDVVAGVANTVLSGKKDYAASFFV